MPLILKYFRELAIAFLVIIAVTLWHDRDKANVEKGKVQERSRVADSVLADVLPKLAHADTEIVHDTVLLRKTIARVDTLRDSVLTHITDTLVVKEYVQRTDSALKVCSDLSNSCQLFRDAATKTIGALESKLANVPKPQRCARVCGILLGVGGSIFLKKAMR